MKLVTNNPRFERESFKNIEIEFLEVDYLGVLKKARDYVHENWEILTHPLYGSVKPNETIYRSILIKKSDSLELASIALISEACETFEKFKKSKATPNWSKSVKDDFSVIDYDLITNAIKRII